jgi:hypothetical protein
MGAEDFEVIDVARHLEVAKHLGDVFALVDQPVSFTELADNLLGVCPALDSHNRVDHSPAAWSRRNVHRPAPSGVDLGDLARCKTTGRSPSSSRRTPSFRWPAAARLRHRLRLRQSLGARQR